MSEHLLSAPALEVTPEFSREMRREILDRAMFQAGKHDPQMFDAPAIAPFALRMAPSLWSELSTAAEAAWRECVSLERSLAEQPGCWARLGIAPGTRRLLERSLRTESPAVRFCRMDFHPTLSGWRVSEINADVPGGFLEAGELTRIVADCFPGLHVPPDPAAALATAIAGQITHLGAPPLTALVHATSYSDDRQVMRCIGRALERHGVRSVFAAPDHLRRAADSVELQTSGERVGGVVRFYPGEWLQSLSRKGRTLAWLNAPGLIQSNPLAALLLQSKRIPCVIHELGLQAPTWEHLLPRTQSVASRWFHPRLLSPRLVLKPTWGRVGHDIIMSELTGIRRQLAAETRARLQPTRWILQDRFTSLPARNGSHLCLGVYVIDGACAGVYARVSTKALIDSRAQDAAVLLDPRLDDPTGSRRLAAAERNVHGV